MDSLTTAEVLLVIASEIFIGLPPYASDKAFSGGGTKSFETSVKSDKIIPVLVEAFKEQQKTIEKQQRQINALTCQVEILLSVFPIKNKEGDVVRALAIITNFEA